MGKRRCRGALHNCGDSAWYLADRASVVECGARAPLCLGLRPAVQKARAQMPDMSHRFFACSLSAQRYRVLRMTPLIFSAMKHQGIGEEGAWDHLAITTGRPSSG